MFRRFGVEIPDQTMCGWMRQSGRIARSSVCASEAVCAELEGSGHRRYAGESAGPQLKAGDTKGAILAVSRGSQPKDGGVRLHANQGTRRPEQFLKTYRGYLQADAYVAYDSFFTNPERGLVCLLGPHQTPLSSGARY